MLDRVLSLKEVGVGRMVRVGPRCLLDELFSGRAETLTKRQSSVVYITRPLSLVSWRWLTISLIICS